MTTFYPLAAILELEHTIKRFHFIIISSLSLSLSLSFGRVLISLVATGRRTMTVQGQKERWKENLRALAARDRGGGGTRHAHERYRSSLCFECLRIAAPFSRCGIAHQAALRSSPGRPITLSRGPRFAPWRISKADGRAPLPKQPHATRTSPLTVPSGKIMCPPCGPLSLSHCETLSSRGALFFL